MDKRPDLPRFYKPMRDPLPPEFYGEIRRPAILETPASPNPAEEIRENARVKEEWRQEFPDVSENSRVCEAYGIPESGCRY